MTLELIPNNELTFKGPFNIVSITALELSNGGNERLAYKIKTTAPKRYCVKPNSGFLDAHSTTSVQVMLQPQALGQLDDRSKHKFMVQWVAVPSTYTEDVDTFWKQDLKGLGVQDSKLKCVFDDEQPAVNSNSPPPRATESTNVTENRTQKQTPTSSPSTFATRSPSSVTRSTNLQFTSQDRPQELAHHSNNSHLKEDIDHLRAENEILKQRLKQQETGLRQRPTTDTPIADRVKLNQHQANGLVLFGVTLTEQVLLVAFVIALLLGFSFGYFLFSCNN